MKALRVYMRFLISEKELRGQKDKRTMHHIGRRPASSKPAERWGEQGDWTRGWIEGQVRSGAFTETANTGLAGKIARNETNWNIPAPEFYRVMTGSEDRVSKQSIRDYVRINLAFNGTRTI